MTTHISTCKCCGLSGGTLKTCYQIVAVLNNEGGADELQRRVNNMISAGFVPFGGLCIDSWENGSSFYQAMVCEMPPNTEAHMRSRSVAE